MIGGTANLSSSSTLASLGTVFSIETVRSYLRYSLAYRDLGGFEPEAWLPDASSRAGSESRLQASITDVALVSPGFFHVIGLPSEAWALGKSDPVTLG